MQALPRSQTDAWSALVNAPDVASFCSAWIQILAGRIDGLRSALLLASDESGVFRPFASWPAEIDTTGLEQVARETLDSGELIVRASPEQGVSRIGYPVESQGILLGAVIIEGTRLNGDLGVHATRELHWASGWLHGILQRATPSESAQAGRVVLEALRALHGTERTFDTALALANYVAQHFSASRVAIGLERGQRIALTAISSTAWFERRSKEVDDIESALDEAVEQRRSIVLPALPGGTNGVSAALARVLGESSAGCVVVLPGSLALGIGAMLVERARQLPLSQGEVLAIEQLARWTGPVLALCVHNDRWLAGKPAQLWQSLRLRMQDKRRPAFKLGVALAALAVVAVTLLPVERNITADAVIEGAREQVLASPFEGYVGSAYVRAGQVVRAGETLAELDTHELKLEAQKSESALAQNERRYVDAMAKRDRTAAGVAVAAMDEAQARLKLSRFRLQRATIRADTDAMVIAGDLSQQLGAPVRQGQTLFRLAPLGDFRVILKVDERDVKYVRESQVGRLVLAGDSSRELPFQVVNIAGAEASNGLNYFRVEARIDGVADHLRPGMEGVGKIHTGKGVLVQIWTRRAVQWAQLQLFRMLP
jgi:multidrug efflux pump subunit AcrA (membrane-fusion protein)